MNRLLSRISFGWADPRSVYRMYFFNLILSFKISFGWADPRSVYRMYFSNSILSFKISFGLADPRSVYNLPKEKFQTVNISAERFPVTAIFAWKNIHFSPWPKVNGMLVSKSSDFTRKMVISKRCSH